MILLFSSIKIVFQRILIIVALLGNRQFAQVLWFLWYDSKGCIYKGNKTSFSSDRDKCLGRNFVSFNLWFKVCLGGFSLVFYCWKQPSNGYFSFDSTAKNWIWFPQPSHHSRGAEMCKMSLAGQIFSILFFLPPVEALLGTTARRKKMFRETVPSPLTYYLSVGGISALWVLWNSYQVL